MTREKLKDLVTTGMIKGNCSTKKQQGKILYGLTNWLSVGRVTVTKFEEISRCAESHDCLCYRA